LVSREVNVGDRVEIVKNGKTFEGQLCELPFC